MVAVCRDSAGVLSTPFGGWRCISPVSRGVVAANGSDGALQEGGSGPPTRQPRGYAHPMTTLKGKTVLITGASRGIGKAIGIRAARDGANVAVLAKTVEPNPKLPGTIHEAAAEMEAAGGQALAVACDLRDEDAVCAAVAATVDRFGGIDVLVNNASAIWLAGISETPMKRFDLMHQVNVRATYLATQACLPHLERAENPHVLVNAPPADCDSKWFGAYLAYALAKHGMSLCVVGLSQELRSKGIGVNALWPRTTIATAAIQNLLGGDDMVRRSRRPEIMADAAHAILVRDAKTCTGNFFIDDEVLAEEGVTDLVQYAVDPTADLQGDLFL